MLKLSKEELGPKYNSLHLTKLIQKKSTLADQFNRGEHHIRINMDYISDIKFFINIRDNQILSKIRGYRRWFSHNTQIIIYYDSEISNLDLMYLKMKLHEIKIFYKPSQFSLRIEEDSAQTQRKIKKGLKI